MSEIRRSHLAIGGLWVALLVTALAARPVLPFDQAPTLHVARMLWERHQFLVPDLPGATPGEGPPLVFWLLDLGWWVFGRTALWPRLIAPLVSLANLSLATHLARRLWPGQEEARQYTPILSLGTLLWTLLTVLVLFDLLLTFFTLVGMVGMARAWRTRSVSGWVQAAVAVGFGLLAKGPVILLYLGPVMALAPWWMRGEGQRTRWHGWYAGAALAVVGGIALALAWAIPAARAGGGDYARRIFLGRDGGPFTHAQPVWWYLVLYPLALFPWVVWPPVWRALRGLWRSGLDAGSRLAVAWLLPALGGLALLHGKHVQYLLPLFPASALLASRALAASHPHVRRWDVLPPGIGFAAIGVALVVLRFLLHPGALPDSVARASMAGGAVVVAASVALIVAPVRRTMHSAIALAFAVAVVIGTTHLTVVQLALEHGIGPATATLELPARDSSTPGPP